MRELLKILGYIASVMIGGAMLAPPLWWLGQWGIAMNLTPALRPFAFDKYFNRAALLFAVALLPWLIRSLGLGGWRALGIVRRDHARGLRDGLLGLGLALGGFATTTALLTFGGAVRLHANTSVKAWALAGLAAVVVSPLEEVLFRGVFLGVLRRTMGAPLALVSLSLLFASLHFLRPNPAMPKPDVVTVWSGMQLLPHLLWEYGQLSRLWASGLTLTAMGLVLGFATIRTQSLYLSIGLHAGWVFGAKALSLTGVAQSRDVFWIGDDWRSGAAPLGLMVVTGAVLYGALVLRAPRRRSQAHSGRLDEAAAS